MQVCDRIIGRHHFPDQYVQDLHRKAKNTSSMKTAKSYPDVTHR